MVCEKNSDVDFDFEKDSLKLKVEGDFVSAKGTTLGGDDGIAVAYVLAILEDDTLEHPELEVVTQRMKKLEKGPMLWMSVI